MKIEFACATIPNLLQDILWGIKDFEEAKKIYKSVIKFTACLVLLCSYTSFDIGEICLQEGIWA